VKRKRSIAVSLTAAGTLVDHTKGYLPPGRSDIPSLTPAEAGALFSNKIKKKLT